MSSAASSTAPFKAKAQNPDKVSEVTDGSKKRKRNDVDASDPKLQEFLGVMQPANHSSGQIHGTELAPAEELPSAEKAVPVPEADSDDEYETIPSRKSDAKGRERKRPKAEPENIETSRDHVLEKPDTAKTVEKQAEEAGEQPSAIESASVPQGAVTAAVTSGNDDDWLRSRTNRLLDLVDPEDIVPAAAAAAAPIRPSSPDPPILDTNGDVDMKDQDDDVPDTSKSVQDTADHPTEVDTKDSEIEAIRRTKRLFVRNLAYSATEDDLKEHFERFGSVEEVRTVLFTTPDVLSMMNPR